MSACACTQASAGNTKTAHDQPLVVWGCQADCETFRACGFSGMRTYREKHVKKGCSVDRRVCLHGTDCTPRARGQFYSTQALENHLKDKELLDAVVSDTYRREPGRLAVRVFLSGAPPVPCSFFFFISLPNGGLWSVSIVELCTYTPARLLAEIFIAWPCPLRIPLRGIRYEPC